MTKSKYTREPLSPEKRRAIDALNEAICCSITIGRSKRIAHAGAVIEMLPAATREALQHLTSDDLAQFRYGWVG